MLWAVGALVVIGAGLPLTAWLATGGLARRPPCSASFFLSENKFFAVYFILEGVLPSRLSDSHTPGADGYFAVRGREPPVAASRSTVPSGPVLHMTAH